MSREGEYHSIWSAVACHCLIFLFCAACDGIQNPAWRYCPGLEQAPARQGGSKLPHSKSWPDLSRRIGCINALKAAKMRQQGGGSLTTRPWRERSSSAIENLLGGGM